MLLWERRAKWQRASSRVKTPPPNPLPATERGSKQNSVFSSPPLPLGEGGGGRGFTPPLLSAHQEGADVTEKLVARLAPAQRTRIQAIRAGTNPQRDGKQLAELRLLLGHVEVNDGQDARLRRRGRIGEPEPPEQPRARRPAQIVRVEQLDAHEPRLADHDTPRRRVHEALHLHH